jgi:hypothetical protein
MNGRYWGPWVLGLMLLVAATAERHRGLLALPMVIAALVTRPWAPDPTPMPRATELVFFAAEASHRLDLEDLHEARGDGLREELLLRLLEGIAIAREGGTSSDPSIRFGVGLHEAREPFGDWEPPEDAAIGRGMAANLVAHLGPEAPAEGWLASAGGAALLARCGKRRDCLARALEDAEEPEELAFGYGLAVGPLDALERNALAEVFPTGAFLEGVDHPLAGLHRPVGTDAPLDVPVRASPGR